MSSPWTTTKGNLLRRWVVNSYDDTSLNVGSRYRLKRFNSFILVQEQNGRVREIFVLVGVRFLSLDRLDGYRRLDLGSDIVSSAGWIKPSQEGKEGKKRAQNIQEARSYKIATRKTDQGFEIIHCIAFLLICISVDLYPTEIIVFRRGKDFRSVYERGYRLCPVSRFCRQDNLNGSCRIW